MKVLKICSVYFIIIHFKVNFNKHSLKLNIHNKFRTLQNHFKIEVKAIDKVYF